MRYATVSGMHTAVYKLIILAASDDIIMLRKVISSRSFLVPLLLNGQIKYDCMFWGFGWLYFRGTSICAWDCLNPGAGFVELHDIRIGTPIKSIQVPLLATLPSSMFNAALSFVSSAKLLVSYCPCCLQRC